MNIENLSALADQQIQNSAGALKDFRNAQLSLFKKNGFNSPVLDSYKFTNLETFFGSMSDSANAVDTEKTNFPTLSLQNGELATLDINVPGVKVKKLKDHFEEVKNLFKEENALSHLHHALLNDGIILEVAKNAEVKSPIRIVHSMNKAGLAAPAVVVLAHHFSKVTLIEETVGGGSYASVNETYILAHDGSHVEHIQLDQGSEEGISHSSVFAELAKDATVRSLIFNASGKLNRKNLALNLNAAGAHAESYALYLTNGTEHSDINTVIHHKAADTTSDQMAKGILDGDSKGIFTGKIHIHPKAQRVASGQLNKNLLLSKKAQAHSQPQLEIFADDVKCSHGSTTGQLSDDEVFYLEARGIPADRARTILAHGFGLEIVLKIQNEEARNFISPLILKRLESKFALGRM